MTFDYALARVLHSEGGLTPREIADELGVTQADVQAVLAARKGHLRRVPCADCGLYIAGAGPSDAGGLDLCNACSLARHRNGWSA